LFVVSLLPWVTGLSSLVYLVAAVGLSGWFLILAIRLKFAPKPGLAMRTFGYSIVYLTAIFSALLIDHYMPIGLH
jgi:protoheme IX farnesyltransferase